MNYTPKPIDEEINNGKPETLRSFLGITLSLTIISIVIFFLLNYLVSFFLMKITLKQEKDLLNFSSDVFKATDVHNNQYLTSLKNRLINNASLSDLIDIHLLCSNEKNAYALPGGHILITSSLLELLESENALATVIAHEVGHIINRDHLKNLSFQATMSLILSFVSFNQSSSFLQNISHFSSLGHSRNAESQADTYAKEKILQMYGHLNGASEFFKKMLKKDYYSLSFLSTHPGLKERIAFFHEHTKTTVVKLKKEKQVLSCKNGSL